MPSNKGKYYVPHPADFAILELLPKEGSQLGYHVLAATTTNLLPKLNKDVPKGGELSISELSARLVSMLYAGLVVTVPVMGAKQRRGWQRTRKGELHYEENTGRSLTSPGLQVVNGERSA